MVETLPSNAGGMNLIPTLDNGCGQKVKNKIKCAFCGKIDSVQDTDIIAS